MKFGTVIHGIRGEALIAAARKAEELGFESLWRPDHLIFPTEMPPTYPYAADGQAPLDPHWPFMDGLTVFTYIASHTTTIKFGTAVYILPLRDPVSTAKTVADLDYLTRGRVLFGVGAGWLEEEFEMVGLDFHTRGARMDECIGVLRALWTEEEPEFHGEHYDLGPAAFAPKPFQKPHPPILVGGETPAALRRAARLGDGWYALRHTPESAREHIARLTELRAQYGRADEPFDVTVGGTPSITRDEVEALEEAGVNRIVVTLWRSSRDAIGALEAFAERLL
jgi:probable F420-dependent oxidoreductase